MQQRSLRSLLLALKAALLAGALYVVVAMYASGALVLASVVLVFVALTAYVFGARNAYAARYLYPGLVGVGLFIVLPLVYTVWIGLTRYSSDNLLTFDRATAALLTRTVRKGEDAAYLFTLHRQGDDVRLMLQQEQDEAPASDDSTGDGGQEDDSIFGDEPDAGPSGDEGSIFDEDPDAGAAEATTDAGAGSADAGAEAGAASAAAPAPASTAAPPPRYATPPFRLTGAAVNVTATVMADGQDLGPALELREVVERQGALAKVTIELPGGLRLVNTSLRAFAAEQPLYTRDQQGRLTDAVTGKVYSPNFDTGFYQEPGGEKLIPGFRVFVGAEHFVRIFTDPAFRGPTVSIFLWTVTFAGLSVLFTLLVGAVLAELFSWEGLRFRTAYRLVLFIPYAVPSFISILVFKGLFNEGFGEINVALSQLLGIQPKWFTDPFLAKVMILIVNTWLGFPYMMILCMGLRQSIPKDLYEASALAGAGPFTNYFKITWPLIRRPLLPLLIASFAFNFNNAVLINLLTDGRPDILGARLPAGTNDLLVTFNWRIAFQDATKDYGLAAAIATVVFIIVAALSILNLRLTRAAARETR